MAEWSEVVLSLWSAIIAAGVAAAIGYLKTLPAADETTKRSWGIVDWDWLKFTRTIVLAMVLVLIAMALGLPVDVSATVVEMRLEELGLLSAVVLIADHLAILFWRRVIKPILARRAASA